ncbi:MAG: CDP-alcohol phosphatidyltransferase family protein, partial [candidate division WOR-3 bacterium]
NRVTRFGAFLDSTLDRISECFIFLGLGIFLGRLNWQYTILVILALSGSLLVSYTRARAEGLGITGKVGFFERGTRFFILFIGSILGVKIMVYLLILLVLGTVSTIIQRIIFAYQRC